MKEEAKVYVGIDIAKAHLDVAVGKAERRFGNEAKGIKRLAGWLVAARGSGASDLRSERGL